MKNNMTPEKNQKSSRIHIATISAKKIFISTLIASMLSLSACKKGENTKRTERKQARTEQVSRLVGNYADASLTNFLKGKKKLWRFADMGDASLEVFEKMLNDPAVDINQQTDGMYLLGSLCFQRAENPHLPYAEQKAKLLLSRPDFDWKKQGLADMICAIYGEFDTVFYSMVNDPRLDVNAVFKEKSALFNDYTLLTCASRKNRPGYVSALLKRPDIDVNKTGKNHRSSIMIAAHFGHPQVADILLERPELDLYIVDYRNKTALDQCKDFYIRRRLIARIEQDAMQGSKPAIQALEKIRSKRYKNSNHSNAYIISGNLQNQH